MSKDGQSVQFYQHTVVTPDEFWRLYNANKSEFDKMITNTINKRYEVRDQEGNLYKFSKTRDGPKLLRNYAKHISKEGLDERVTIMETRMKELDFMSNRIRELEELIYHLCGPFEEAKSEAKGSQNKLRLAKCPILLLTKGPQPEGSEDIAKYIPHD